MAKRKRTSRRTDLVGRAVSAGRRALKEAEGRIPPDLRRQLQQRMKDADKTARAAIKTLQTQVQRASTRADVNSVLKRIDGLTRQARQIARGAAATRAAAPRRGAATATRRAATSRTKKTVSTRRAASTARPTSTRAATPKRTATPKPTATSKSRATTRRATTPRRRTEEVVMVEPTEIVVPVAEIDEVEVYEITER